MSYNGEQSQSSFGDYTAGSAFSQQSFSENFVSDDNESWQVQSLASSKYQNSVDTSSDNLAIRSSIEFAKEQLWDSPSSHGWDKPKQPGLEKGSESSQSQSDSYSEGSAGSSRHTEGSYYSENTGSHEQYYEGSFSGEGSYDEEYEEQNQDGHSEHENHGSADEYESYTEESCEDLSNHYSDRDEEEYRDNPGNEEYVENDARPEAGDAPAYENDEHDFAQYEDDGEYCPQDGFISGNQHQYGDNAEYYEQGHGEQQDDDSSSYSSSAADGSIAEQNYEDQPGESSEDSGELDVRESASHFDVPAETGVPDDKEEREDCPSGETEGFRVSLHSHSDRETQVEHNVSSVNSARGEFGHDIQQGVNGGDENSDSAEEEDLHSSSFHMAGGRFIGGDAMSASRSLSSEQKHPRYDDSDDESYTGWESPSNSGSQQSGSPHSGENSQASSKDHDMVVETNAIGTSDHSYDDDNLLPGDADCVGAAGRDEAGIPADYIEGEEQSNSSDSGSISDTQSSRSESASYGSRSVSNSEYGSSRSSDQSSLHRAAHDKNSATHAAMDDIMGTAKNILDEQMSGYFMGDDSTGHDDSEGSGRIENLIQAEGTFETHKSDEACNAASPVTAPDADPGLELEVPRQEEEQDVSTLQVSDKESPASSNRVLGKFQSCDGGDANEHSTAVESGANAINVSIDGGWLESADKALDALQSRQASVQVESKSNAEDAIRSNAGHVDENWFDSADRVLESLQHGHAPKSLDSHAAAPLPDQDWLKNADKALEKLSRSQTSFPQANIVSDSTGFSLEPDFQGTDLVHGDREEVDEDLDQLNGGCLDEDLEANEMPGQAVSTNWLQSADQTLQALRDTQSGLVETSAQPSESLSIDDATSSQSSTRSPPNEDWLRSADVALEKLKRPQNTSNHVRSPVLEMPAKTNEGLDIDSDWLSSADKALQSLQSRQDGPPNSEREAVEATPQSIDTVQEKDLNFPDSDWLRSADLAIQRLTVQGQPDVVQAGEVTKDAAQPPIPTEFEFSKDASDESTESGSFDVVKDNDRPKRPEAVDEFGVDHSGVSSGSGAGEIGSKEEDDLWGMEESSCGTSSNLSGFFGRPREDSSEDDDADEMRSIMSDMSDDLGMIEEDNEDSTVTKSPSRLAPIEFLPVSTSSGASDKPSKSHNIKVVDTSVGVDSCSAGEAAGDIDDVETGLNRTDLVKSQPTEFVSSAPEPQTRPKTDKLPERALSGPRSRTESDEAESDDAKSYKSTLDNMSTDDCTVAGLSKNRKAAIVVICSVVLLLILILPWVIWSKNKKSASNPSPPSRPSQPIIPPPAPTLSPNSHLLRPWTLVDSVQGGEESQAGAAIGINRVHAVIGEPSASRVGVRRYRSSEVQWEERAPILSDGEDDRFGAAIDLLGDILIVGAPTAYATEANIQVGRAICFQYNPIVEDWQPLGDTLRGDNELAVALGEEFGSSVSVSIDYKAVVGAPRSNAIDSEAGRIYTFRYVSSLDQWVSLDVFPITGNLAGDRFGTSVAISTDGDRFIVGAPGGSNKRGYVFLYEWKNDGWEEVLEIEGESSGERFGSSILILSDSASVIAIGAPGFQNGAGRITVYTLTNGVYQQLGDAIVGNPGDGIGSVDSMAGDASSATLTIVYSTENRQVKRMDYSFDEGEWLTQYRSVITDVSTKTTVSYVSNGSKDMLAVGLPDLDQVFFYDADSLSVPPPIDPPTRPPATKIPSTPPPTYLRAPSPFTRPPDPTNAPLRTPSPTTKPTTAPTPVATEAPVPPSQPIVQSKWLQSGGPYRIGPNGTGFGGALAMSGSKMATGALNGLEVGVVLTFEKVGGAWGSTFSQQLAGREKGGEFGASIDMTGDVMVVGAPQIKAVNSNTPSGAAYCYIHDGQWKPLGAELRGDDGLYAANEKFGTTVAVSSNKRIAVGAPASSVSLLFNRGRVYIYEYQANTGWTKKTDILGKSAGEALGSSLDISSDGKYVIVGSPGKGGGFATIYLHSVFNWIEVSKISGIDREGMGTSVHFIDETGTMAAAGAPGYDNGRGRVVVFMRDSSGKYQQLGPSIVGETGERIGDTKKLAGSGSDPSIIVGTSTGLIKRYDYDLTTVTWVQTVETADTGFRSLTGLLNVVSSGESFAAGGDDTTTIYDLIPIVK